MSAALDLNKQLEASEYLRGRQDCWNGKPHQSGQCEEYNNGYAYQYELEAIQEAQSVSEGN